ncbi:hypothetical protein DSECCO2_537030 [anaerobic digester metagenome]
MTEDICQSQFIIHNQYTCRDEGEYFCLGGGGFDPGRFHSRDIDVESAAIAQITANRDETAISIHYTVNDGESQSGSLAAGFCAEIGIKDAGDELWRDAAAGVANTKVQIGAFQQNLGIDPDQFESGFLFQRDF